MYVKFKFQLLIVALALAIPLMLVGTASAKYQSDGAVQNGTTGGWITPYDGICVLGLHADGSLYVDTTITTARDCQARLVAVTAVTSNDLLSNVCVKGASNTAGVRYAAPGSSTCVTIDASGNILTAKSMVNNDRNAIVCNELGGQLANAVPTTLSNGVVISMATNTHANGTAAQCLAYGWQYRGQDASGNPLPFGTNAAPLSDGTKAGVSTGVSPATQAGFCYTSMRTNLAATACPTVVGSTTGNATANASQAFGYSVSGTFCLYAYGINGTVNAAVTNAVSGATVVAAGAAYNFGQFTTQGQCLLNGGTWSNWVPIGSTATVDGTIPGITTAVSFDLTRQLVSSDEGCLHCHSTKVQTNADVYRQKDSYLQTGHKNMLRKVTPGMAWEGPNAAGALAIYTTDGTNAFNWTTGMDGTNLMYYIYGDWMVPNPTVAIAVSAYSCANCHVAGFSGGTAATPGVQSIGTPGYTGTQPADAGAGYVSAVKAGYKWDLDGIQCGRCHNAAGPSVTQTQISGGTCKNGATDVTANYPTQTACAAKSYTWTAIGTASAFPTTHPTSAGMGSLAAGTGLTNLCFGCHQSIGKSWPTGAAQFDPTVVPVGVSHGAAYGRDFNGHVIGNSFLNSPHARYTGAQSGNGSISANSLGENDLTDPNGTVEYSSIFQGYACFQGAGSGDYALTDALGNPLNTQAKCNAVYGTGAWAVDTNGTQGTCTTCHDVHNSLYVATQASAAIKKTCADCHVNNATTGATNVSVPTVTVINHLQNAGTPFDTALYGTGGECVVCHMASQAVANGNQTSSIEHLWRISVDPNYNTFPTMTAFYGGSCSVHSGAVQNAPSLPVVYASDISSANCTAVSGVWTAAAENRNATTATDTYTTGVGGTYANAVWIDLDLACGQCHGGSLGASATANSAPYFTKQTLATYAAAMHSGNASTPPPATPVVSGAGTATTSGFTATFVDSSTPAGTMVTVKWGDGNISTQVAGSTFTHTYGRAGSFHITQLANGAASPNTFLVSVPTKYTISGIVSSSTGTPLSGVTLALKLNNHTRASAKTASDGSYSFSNVQGGTSGYMVQLYKKGYTFTTQTVGSLFANDTLNISSN